MGTAPRAAALPATLLLAANAVFLGPVLIRGHVFSGHDIVASQFPWRASAPAASPRNPLLADFETSALPSLLRWKQHPASLVWNPRIGSGTPGPMNLVEGFLSPFCLLPAFALPPVWIETGILFLKLNAGFLFAYMFFRREEFPPAAASVGAATFAFSAAQTFWWLWMQSSVALALPLLLWSIGRAGGTGTSRRATFLVALAAIVFVSGGYPFTIVYALLPAFLLAAMTRPDRGRLALRLGTAAAVVAAIFTPAALVSWRFLRQSGFPELRRGIAAASSFPLRDLARLVSPGPAFSEIAMQRACSVGPVAVILAIGGLSTRGHRRLKVAACLPALAIAAALLAGAPVSSIFARIPLLGAAPIERGLFLVVLAIAVLAASAAARIEQKFRRFSWVLPFLIAIPQLAEARKFHPDAPASEATFSETAGVASLRAASFGHRFLATGWCLLPDTAQVFELNDVRSHLFHELAYRELLAGADPRVYGRTGTILTFDSNSLDVSSPVLDRLDVAAVATPPGEHMNLPRAYSGDDMEVYARPTRLSNPIREDGESFELPIHTAGNGVLEIPFKNFQPYLRLFADGKEAPPEPGNSILVRLRVFPGFHRVRVTYRIPVREKVLSLAGIGALAVLAAGLPRSRS